MTKASVVIPNWNGMAHLPMCLDALKEQTFTDFETIVVDNASTDGSVAYLAHRPEVRLVRLDENLGFPAAVNAGVEASNGEYVVLLNNDTKARPDWLEKLVGGMDSHPGFAFGSSKLIRMHTPDLIDSVGHSFSLWLGAGSNVGEEEGATGFTEPAWLFGACAAASIYRRSLFEDIGGLDEDFFFTHEDLEFDLRANMAGHRCILIPDAIVYHKRGASYEVSAGIDLMGLRNRIWMIGKNLPPLALVMLVAAKALRMIWWIPARLIGRPPGRGSGQNRDPVARAKRHIRIRDAAKAVTDAIRTLPAKRRASKRIRRLSTIELVRVMRSTRIPQPLSDAATMRPSEQHR